MYDLNYAFTAYKAAGLSLLEMRERLELDFPLMNEEVLTKAEKTIFSIFGSAEDKSGSDIEWIRITQSRYGASPIWLECQKQFVRDWDPDLVVKVRVANLNFGTGPCEETYVVGYRLTDEEVIPLETFCAYMDKDTIAQTYQVMVNINDLCPKNSSYVQSMEFVVWKQDDRDYEPHRMSIKLINRIAKCPKKTEWKLHAIDGKVYANVSFTNAYKVDFNKEFSYMECGMAIDEWDSEKMMDISVFSRTIKLEYIGDHVFKTTAPLFAFDYNDEVFQKKIPVFRPTKNSYEVGLYLWGSIEGMKMIHLNDSHFEESDI